MSKIHSSCVHLIPYTVDEKKSISLVLGLSSVFKEWTSLGGNCNVPGCIRPSKRQVRNALSREIFEETKKLVKLDKVVKNIQDLQKLQYDVTDNNSVFHTTIFFLPIFGEKLRFFKNMVEKFNSKQVSRRFIGKNISRGFLEMTRIEFVSLDTEFPRYVYNTFQDIQRRWFFYEEKGYLEGMMPEIGEMLQNTPIDKYSTDTRCIRLNPLLLTGFINSLTKYYSIKKFTGIKDFIDVFSNFLLEETEKPEVIDSVVKMAVS